MNTYIKKIISKIVSLVIAVAIMPTALVGCGESTDPVNTTVRTYTTDGKETKLVGNNSLTGELTIATTYLSLESLVDETYGDAIARTKKLFEQMYPNVKLNITRLSPSEDFDEYSTKLSTSIMAGNGPDILFFTPDYSPTPSGVEFDLYKMAKSGALADMYDYFEADKNFMISDYNEKIFYGLQISGGQHIIPVMYETTAILTSKENAEKYNLDLSKCTNYENCIKQIGNMLNKAEVDKQNKTPLRIASNAIMQSGIPFIDYNKGTAMIDTPEIKKYYELQKKYLSNYASDMVMITGGAGAEGEQIMLGKETLAEPFFTFLDGLTSMEIINMSEKEPVMIPWKDVNGKTPAILTNAATVSSSCKDKQLAYEFIKTLISEEIMSNDLQRHNFGIPICNNAVDKMTTIHSNAITAQSFEDLVKPLSPETQKNVDAVTKIINNTEWVIMPSLAYSIVYTEMLPYLKDEKSYEECIQSAQSKLEIYISE